MAIEKIWDGAPQNCNGVTTVFPIGFDYGGDATLIEVLRITIATGETILLAQGSDYTVDTNTNQITTATAHSSAYQLMIQPNPTLTQTIDLKKNGIFDPNVIDGGFDKGILIDQRSSVELGRSLRVLDAPMSPIPNVAARANKVPMFDANGDIKVVDVIPEGSITASAFGQDFITAADKGEANRKLSYINQTLDLSGMSIAQAQTAIDNIGKDMNGYTLTITRTGVLSFGTGESLSFKGFRNGLIDFQVDCTMAADTAGPSFSDCSCEIKLSKILKVSAASNMPLLTIDTSGAVLLSGATFDFGAYANTAGEAVEIKAHAIELNAATVTGTGSCVTFLKATTHHLRLVSSTIGNITITTGIALTQQCFVLNQGTTITATTQITSPAYDSLTFGTNKFLTLDDPTYKRRLLSQANEMQVGKVSPDEFSRTAIGIRGRTGAAWPQLFVAGSTTGSQEWIATNKQPTNGEVGLFPNCEKNYAYTGSVGAAEYVDYHSFAMSEDAQNLAFAGYLKTAGPIYVLESNDGGSTWTRHTLASTERPVIAWIGGQFYMRVNNTQITRWTPGNWASRSINTFTDLGRHISVANGICFLHGRGVTPVSTSVNFVRYDGSNFTEWSVDFLSLFPFTINYASTHGHVIFKDGAYCMIVTGVNTSTGEIASYLFSTTNFTNWTRQQFIDSAADTCFGLAGKVENEDYWYLTAGSYPQNYQRRTSQRHFIIFHQLFQGTVFLSDLAGGPLLPLATNHTAGSNKVVIYAEYGLLFYQGAGQTDWAMAVDVRALLS